MKRYFDERDISFRITASCMSLPGNTVQKLSQWAVQSSMRVNIFKKTVEMLVDINRRDGDCSFADSIVLDGDISGRELEQDIFQKIFEKRFPEYSSMRKRAERCIRELNVQGMTVDFPEYF